MEDTAQKTDVCATCNVHSTAGRVCAQCGSTGENNPECDCGPEHHGKKCVGCDKTEKGCVCTPATAQ